MRASSLFTRGLLLAALSGCSLGGEPTPPPPEPGNGLFTELPERKTTLSGVVFDPEAFFFSLATFPEGENPEDAPPPALFEGIPYLMRAATVGARVSVMSGATVADTSGPAPQNGYWQVQGVPTGAPYTFRAVPPEEGVVVGAPDFFPSPPFEPVPQGKYYPTTTLIPMTASSTSCHAQAATMVGEGGALGALANLLTDMTGTETTPADLVDPEKTGGVALIWVYGPSPVFDLFDAPLGGPEGGVAAETDKGTLYGLDWAPPGVIPGPVQSPMGYMAMPESMSPMGYFALVLPKGHTGPVTLHFIDQGVTPEGEEGGPFGPRPYVIEPLTVEVGPGVSFARVHAFSPAMIPPEDPLAEPVPEPDFSWLCRF